MSSEFLRLADFSKGQAEQSSRTTPSSSLSIREEVCDVHCLQKRSLTRESNALNFFLDFLPLLYSSTIIGVAAPAVDRLPNQNNELFSLLRLNTFS